MTKIEQFFVQQKGHARVTFQGSWEQCFAFMRHNGAGKAFNVFDEKGICQAEVAYGINYQDKKHKEKK